MRDISEVLESTWGFSSFRPHQEDVVRSVLEGRDTLALLPTGGGKSLCFQVPAIAMGKLCLVVSPLVALMKDQVDRLRGKGIRATAITSGMDLQEIDNAIESAAFGKTAFLYVSPERLGSEVFAARLHRLPLGLIAVDEAHCISQWGYDFRPAYLRIAEVRDKHPEVPVLALTASATRQVAEDIMAQLKFKQPNLIRGSFARPELTFWMANGEDKMGRLLRIANKVEGSGIVYLRERRGTVRIAQFLQQHGISAAAYHAGLSYEERDRIQQQWTSGEVRFVAATNAFGMGIDKADVRSVIHLEPPPDLESYYQEAGRAGRDGHPSYAFLLLHGSDEEKMREKLRRSFPSIAEVRRVYQAFADQHRIALGSGEFEAYDLDLRELARRTALQPATVNNAMKALELDGTLALSDGARAPSRVFMRADPRVVYDMRVKSGRTGELLETLLRMYGGLFEEPAIVEENRIAAQLKWSTGTVVTCLHDLQKQNVLFYRPRNDSPTATLLVPRRDAERLMLDKEALQAREQRATARMDSMIRFAFRTDECRERVILRYFNDDTAPDCGRCDVCRSRSIVAVNDLIPAVSSIDRTAGELEVMRWMIDEQRAEIAPPPSM